MMEHQPLDDPVGPQHLVCPLCLAALGSLVVDSRVTRGGTLVRRRRECLACLQRFTTYELTWDPTVWDEQRARGKLVAAQLRQMADALDAW